MSPALRSYTTANAERGTVESVPFHSRTASFAGKSVRVRVVDNRTAFLTIKFKREGIVRDEFEYAIPLPEAEELLERAAGAVIEKSRYQVPAGKFVWEIDVFHGAHSGLTIAEIEML